jgi:peroxiredoxin
VSFFFRVCFLLAVPAAFAEQPAAQAGETASPFLSVPSAASDSLRFRLDLPDFEAKDIAGRTWRKEDLRGKFTVVFIWSTGAARAMDKVSPTGRAVARGIPDLRDIQRFYDKVHDSPGIQVLTFCTDYDYTHAPEYIRHTAYTFPVIADWLLLRKLFGRGEPSGGRLGLLSLIWVVDPRGRVSEPFRSWSFGRVLYEVEAAAARN